MTNRPAMTFSPGIAIDANGQEYFDVNSGTITSRSGFQSPQVVEYDEETGESRYLITDEELQQDADYTADISDEYLEAILEAYPQMEQALEWAADGGYTEAQVEAYNEAMERFSPEEMMPLIEKLMEEYHEANPEPDPIREQDIDAAYQEAAEQEPQGLETAFQWLEYAEKTQSDEVLSGVAMLTASFHKGDITAEQAYQIALERYDIQELKRVYNTLNQR